MRAALLLIDLQQDFLARPRLSPAATVLVDRASALLAAVRERGVPVIHCRTRVAADGGDRMPHWRAAGLAECVEGTPGERAPAGLEALAGEAIVHKRFFSAFGNPALDALLHERGVDTLILAGNYVHGCVRATAFDAYELGFEVWIAGDAVGTTEPDHAEMTRLYLEGRAAEWLSSKAILQRFDGEPSAIPAAVVVAPGARDALDRECLRACAGLLEERVEPLARLLADEIGKPVRYGRAEIRAAAAHVRYASELVPAVDTRPLGVVALITPWNNPIAIPLGKLAPALALGNGVVWKAAMEAPRAAQAVMDLLGDAGVPAAAVQLLFGDGETVRGIIDAPEVAAVSITGSIATGRAVAVRCLRAGKPLQAELGGNNAAIVLRDFDFRSAANELARSAFGFAGQRCTATRRFIVERAILPEFEEAFVAATRALPVGEPLDDATEVGPLVSRGRRAALLASLEGAALLCGGGVPEGLEHGAWMSPTIVRGDPRSRLAQEESFGPIALVLAAEDFDHALALANDVEHGLAATLLTNDPASRRRFAEEAQAGILKFTAGPFEIAPSKPFGGWKASGLGPPEHGRWDLDFYTRPQARYGGP